MKKQSLAIVAVVCVCFFAGCEQRTGEQTVPMAKPSQTLRTDAGPITRRLPKLGHLEAVWWTSTKVTTNSLLSPPEHPAYRVQGFAQLRKQTAEDISTRFQWQRTPGSWKPDLIVTDLKLASAEWNQSSGFTKDCKPQQIPGSLFFEPKLGIVYFDLEIE